MKMENNKVTPGRKALSAALKPGRNIAFFPVPDFFRHLPVAFIFLKGSCGIRAPRSFHTSSSLRFRRGTTGEHPAAFRPPR
jgi:hypothetical protein